MQHSDYSLSVVYHSQPVQSASAAGGLPWTKLFVLFWFFGGCIGSAANTWLDHKGCNPTALCCLNCAPNERRLWFLFDLLCYKLHVQFTKGDSIAWSKHATLNRLIIHSTTSCAAKIQQNAVAIIDEFDLGVLGCKAFVITTTYQEEMEAKMLTSREMLSCFTHRSQAFERPISTAVRSILYVWKSSLDKKTDKERTTDWCAYSLFAFQFKL